MSDRYISSAVIRRLPQYYRFLGKLTESGVERISSKELSEELKMTASQIRQDLNNFGGFGQQGYGYNVAFLYSEIGKILGVDRKHAMIIIGAGNVGAAIANYTTFERNNFRVEAIFDSNPELLGKELRGIVIRNIKELEGYLKEHEIHIAVLTVPGSHAQLVADQLVSLGVKAIWNFAPVDLKLPEDVVVEHVQLLDSLMRLSYSMKDREGEQG